MKFTPFNGHVKISVKRIKTVNDLTIQDDKLCETVVGNPKKSYLEFQVEDTGIGMKEEDLGKLF